MNSWIIDKALDQSCDTVRRSRELLEASRSEISDMRESLVGARDCIQRSYDSIRRTDRFLHRLAGGYAMPESPSARPA